MRRLLLAALLGASPILSAAATAAEPAGKGAWMLLPGSFTGTGVVRAAAAAPRIYRVVVEIPTTPDPDAARPRIAKSSGEPVVDRLAMEFARDRAVKVDKVRALIRTQVAVFQLELHAPNAGTSSYVDRPPGAPPKTPNAQYYTPVPPFPGDAAKKRGSGDGLIRVVWEAGKSKPSYAFMDRSTGVPLLDTSTLQWAILYWERYVALDRPATVRVPMTYRVN